MQYLNNKYALTLHKSVKKSGTQLSTAHGTPLSVLDWESNWPRGVFLFLTKELPID